MSAFLTTVELAFAVAALTLVGCATVSSEEPDSNRAGVTQPLGQEEENRMTQYEIAAELLGMDGHIHGEQQVRFVNHTDKPIDSLVGGLMLSDAVFHVDGSAPKSIEPVGLLRMIAEQGARLFRIKLAPQLRPGEIANMQFDFSGVITPDEKYHADAVAASLLWHPFLIEDRENYSDIDEILAPSEFSAELIVPKGFETAISADTLTETILSDGRKQLKTRLRRAYDLTWISSERYRVAKSASPEGEIRVYYTDLEERQAPFIAEVAAQVSAFYSDLMGCFPWPLVSLVPGRRDVSGGGMPDQECSCCTRCTCCRFPIEIEMLLAPMASWPMNWVISTGVIGSTATRVSTR